MFKSYLKIALRNLRRQKIYSFINIAGLAIGMACAILILLWVQDELTFDRFHENGNRIYRVLAEWSGQKELSSRTPGRLGPAAKEEIPEIVNSARLSKGTRSAFKYGDKAFYEEGHFEVDPSFFEMFTFPATRGDAKMALEDAQSLVITEKIAEKYFGKEDPIGKFLNWNNWRDYKVSGVLKNLPQNSSLQFSFLNSHHLTEKYWPGGYTWSNFIQETYVQLRDDANPEQVGEKLTALLHKNNPYKRSQLKKLHLQPLSDLHLNADIGRSNVVGGDRKYIYVFSLIAFFVLLIACINFMNLSTARSMQRAKEVGMRKVVGADRSRLIGQFLGESVLLAFMAFFVALFLVEAFLPTYNLVSAKQLTIDYSDIQLFLGFGVVILATGIIAGSYPAFYLSGFRPVSVLKGTTRLSPSGKHATKGNLRNGLVVTQFALSVLLIICAIVVYNQLDFMRNKKLGFDKENVIYIPAKGEVTKKFETVRNELLQDPGIIGVTAKNSLPMFALNTVELNWQGKTGQRFPLEAVGVDFNFFEVLNLNFVTGRPFSKEISTDAEQAIIINEEAARLMEMESPIGKWVSLPGNTERATIIGVVKNPHFKSLHHKIEPQVFHVLGDLTDEAMDLFGIILIKIRGEEIPETVAKLENIWNEVNPGIPFEYHFLDETIDKQYAPEKTISKIVTYFTLIAIFISCIGLFGLAAYMAEQRTKEIGIRKVLGASVSGIVSLLSKEFTKWMALANIIAWPLAFVVMTNWLQEFAYRVSISWWVFLVAGASALIIALLTVSYQAIKAAVANPVDALRYE